MHPLGKSLATGLISAAALFVVVEDWRGKRDWEAFLKEQTAKGESFDYRRLLPPPVPDEKNFAHIPQLRPLFDYERNGTRGINVQRTHRDPKANERALALLRIQSDQAPPAMDGWRHAETVSLTAYRDYLRTDKSLARPDKPGAPAADILFALRRFDGEMDALTKSAKQRPQARFDVNYADHFAALLPHLGVLRNVARVYTLRALARLHTGDIAGAWADVDMLLFLSDSIGREPTLISHLVRIAIVELALQPVWEGLATGRWTPVQLRAMQERLAAMDFLAHHRLAMLAERDFSNLMMEEFRTKDRKQMAAMLEAPGAGDAVLFQLAPEGWLRQNQLRYNRVHLDYIAPIVDVAKRRVYPDVAKEFGRRVADSRRTPYTVMIHLLLPALGQSTKRSNAAQTAVDQAAIACALERYRQANGKWPDTLAQLSPQWLAKVPQDLVSGQPMKFKAQPDGGYLLWAVGWNQKDDGGKPGVRREGNATRNDLGSGDLVWRQPMAKR